MSAQLTDMTLFPLFAPEIRLKIWEMTLVPRRIILKDASSRPRSDSRSFLALRLVNRESHSVIQLNYSLILHESDSRGIYFNKSLDTLCLPTGMKTLRQLLKSHHASLMGLRWLDLGPCRSLDLDQDTSQLLRSISSIELITIRSLGAREEFMDSLAIGDLGTDLSRAIPCAPPYTMGDNMYDFDVVHTLQQMAKALGMDKDNGEYHGPKLAALFSPDECQVARARSDLTDLSRCIWGELSPSTWDRIENALPQTLTWPGREAAKKDFWFVWEVTGLKKE